MASEPQSIDVTDSPELLKLVEEVARSGQPRRLCRGGKTVAVVSPVVAAARKRPPARRRRTGLLNPEDPFWNLVGIGRSGLDDVSSNKQQYLAEAYYPDEQPPQG